MTIATSLNEESLNSGSIETDSVSISETPIPERKRGHLAFTRVIVTFILVFTPIWFGGVHGPIYSTIYTAIFLSLLYLIVREAGSLSQVFSLQLRSSSLVILTVGLVLIYAIAQSILLGSEIVPHPILGQSSKILDFGALRSFLIGWSAFCAFFILIRAVLLADPRSHEWLSSLILGVGLIVSLIAISHWFYDNGRLFWTFEADNLTVSSRARWPFVNPNHLGHFLLPIFFLALSLLIVRWVELSEFGPSTGKSSRKRADVSTMLASSRFQSKVSRLIFAAITLIVSAVAIFASQSRGAWLGSAIALAIFLVGERVIRAFPDDTFGLSKSRAKLEAVVDSEPVFSDIQQKRRSRHRRSGRSSELDLLLTFRKIISKIARPAVALMVVVLVYLFLNEKGRELVEQRINYGLLYSKDDMRWTFDRDTLHMIHDHPIWGVGFGGWDAAYPHYADPLLSGTNPVYLHSDPLQFLSEGGILGGSLLLAGVLISLAMMIRAIKVCRHTEYRLQLLGLISGLIGIFVASCLDFPFRIPGITLVFGALLSLTTFYADKLLTDTTGRTGSS